MTSSPKAPLSTPVVLTMGEPAGIAGEITLAAWLARREWDLPPFLLLDDPERLAQLARRIGLEVPVIEIASPEAAIGAFARGLPVLPVSLPRPISLGAPDPATASAVIESIDRAVALTREGHAAAIVTNPIQKQTLYDAGFNYAGHTDYLGALCDVANPVMMLACPELRVVPVTTHVSLADAIESLTSDAIVATCTVVERALREDFGIDRPRLTVAALNPHAGEGGTLGREEIEVIAPALDRLRELGVEVSGPFAADSMFHEAARGRYDAAICMYHDQALIPLKTIDFERGVNVTLGLPFVRTSPDHGTALHLAGTGEASATSLLEAIRLAAEMTARRVALAGARQRV